MVTVTIVNIVASTIFAEKLDLDIIAELIECTDYEPKQFPQFFILSESRFETYEEHYSCSKTGLLLTMHLITFDVFCSFLLFLLLFFLPIYNTQLNPNFTFKKEKPSNPFYPKKMKVHNSHLL